MIKCRKFPEIRTSLIMFGLNVGIIDTSGKIILSFLAGVSGGEEPFLMIFIYFGEIIFYLIFHFMKELCLTVLYICKKA